MKAQRTNADAKTLKWNSTINSNDDDDDGGDASEIR